MIIPFFISPIRIAEGLAYRGRGMADSENLAQRQGGNDVTAHAQSASSEVNNMAAFIAKGETVLANFAAGMKGFEEMGNRIKLMEQAIVSLQKTPQPSQSDAVAGPSGCKKRKIVDDATPPSTSHKSVTVDVEDSEDDDSDHDALDNIDAFLENDSSSSDDEEDCFLSEVQEFLVIEKQVGEDINNDVARTINMALRGKIDPVKMKVVWDRNKRPQNVPTLQIPRVPGTLWGQLSNGTKSSDAAKQKMIGQANLALVPLVKAMSHIKETKMGDKTLTTYLGDCFKILASQITTANHDRRESIKQELTPQFKELCNDENPASSTELFGDNFSEKVKILDQAKTVKMTKKSQSQPFLPKQGESTSINKHNKGKTLPSQSSVKPGYRKSQKGVKHFKSSNKTSKNGNRPHYQQKNRYQ